MDIVQRTISVPEPRPDLLGVEDSSVDDDGRDSGKGKTVAERERRGQEDWRVLLVLVYI